MTPLCQNISMQKWQYNVSLALSVVVLLLTITLIVTGKTNQDIQQQLQKQQLEINKGQVSQQIGTALLKDMAVASVNNSKIKDLLAKHGFTVSQNQKPAGQ
jgi:NADH:ubiquinone oxidoreductase subunit 6 (subunit J)